MIDTAPCRYMVIRQLLTTGSKTPLLGVIGAAKASEGDSGSSPVWTPWVYTNSISITILILFHGDRHSRLSEGWLLLPASILHVRKAGPILMYLRAETLQMTSGSSLSCR
jgi:hypothetical protein